MKVAVVRCEDYDSVKDSLEKALDLIGGMDIKKGDKVLAVGTGSSLAEGSTGQFPFPWLCAIVMPHLVQGAASTK